MTIKELWWQWVSLVDSAAGDARSRAHLRLASDQYRVLHSDLLKALQEQAEKAESSQREFYLELITWVEPWLTVETLLRTDQEILGDLVQRCTLVGDRMGPRPRARRPLPWKWIAGLTAASLVIALVSLAVFTRPGRAVVLTRGLAALRAIGKAGGMDPWHGTVVWLGAAALLTVFVYAFLRIRRRI